MPTSAVAPRGVEPAGHGTPNSLDDFRIQKKRMTGGYPKN